MARLLTYSYETQKVATTAARDPEGQGTFSVSGSNTFNTVTPRGGAACAVHSAASGGTMEFDFTNVALRDYYLRVAFRFPALPFTATTYLMAAATIAGPAALMGVQIGTDSKLQLFDNGSTAVGSKSATLSANTWYVVEFHYRTSQAQPTSALVGLRVDGATVQADMAANSIGLATCAVWGKLNNNDTTNTVRTDDVALNDDQGASEASWPGSGKVALLKPVSDGARNNWTGGAGGTTNLFGAVDNAPPTGVAVGASSTDSTQIENPTSSALNSYTANLAKYTDSVASGGGGMAANDPVRIVYALGRTGNSTTTSRSMSVTATNPSTTTVTASTGTTAAGTETTGWTTLLSVPSYSPSVTLATTPTASVVKNVATTDVNTCDLLGLLVEWNTYFAGAADVAGAGTIAATGVRKALGAAAVAGTGTVAATGTLKTFGVAAVAGTGTIAATGTRTVHGAASVAGTGTISATGAKIITGSAAVAGIGTVSASGTRKALGVASLAGAGSIVASGTRKALGVAAVAGTGTISASGEVLIGGSAAISGTGTISATGTRRTFGVAQVAGQGVITATGLRETFGVGDLAGEGTIEASGAIVYLGEGAIAGEGVIEASGRIYERWNLSTEDRWPPDSDDRWEETTEERWEITVV